MDDRLHPNLARVAAAYDDLFEQFARGQLSAADAKARIRNLIARDDSGIEWTLNPDDRNWYRRTVHGDWVRDRPPTMGVKTASGWDMSGHDPMADPRHRVSDTRIDPRLVTDPDVLRGSTARMVRNHPEPAPVPRRTERARWAVAIATAVVTVSILVWLFTAWNSPLRDDPTPREDPTVGVTDLPGAGTPTTTG